MIREPMHLQFELKPRTFKWGSVTLTLPGMKFDFWLGSTRYVSFAALAPECPAEYPDLMGMSGATPLAADFTGDGHDDLALVCPDPLTAPSQLEPLKWIIWPFPYTDPTSVRMIHAGYKGDIPLALKDGQASGWGSPLAYPAAWNPTPSSTTGYCSVRWYDISTQAQKGVLSYNFSSTTVFNAFDYRCGLPLVADQDGNDSDELVVFLRRRREFYSKAVGSSSTPSLLGAFGTATSFVMLR